ncbi:hypothetical protein PVK73_28155 [Bacillus thuringiensis]
MKKMITSILIMAITAASLPITTFAADHSDPVTKNGERVKYNTPYYIKDKTLPNKGGVIVEPWVLDDFVRFADSPVDNGTPVIFENKDRTDGFIESGDWMRIKSTKANSGSQYWNFDEILGSVYLNYDTRTDHRMYGSSTDNSIGLGNYFVRPEIVGTTITKGIPSFRGYKGEHTEKAWMKAEVNVIPNEKDIQTPLEVIEAHE